MKLKIVYSEKDKLFKQSFSYHFDNKFILHLDMTFSLNMTFEYKMRLAKGYFVRGKGSKKKKWVEITSRRILNLIASNMDSYSEHRDLVKPLLIKELNKRFHKGKVVIGK